MDDKNDTSSERIRQGISADGDSKKYLKQYGRLPFGITPHLAKSKASNNALLLYIDLSQLLFRGAEALCTYPVADSTLAERIGLDARKVGNARRELAKKGIIQASQFVTKQGKLVPGTWTYRLKFESELSGESTEEQLLLPDDDPTPTTELPKNGNTHYQKSVTGMPKNGNGHYQKSVMDLEGEKGGNSDGNSVSLSGEEGWTNPSTNTIPTTTTKPLTDRAEEVQESDKADEWIEQQTYWSKQMGGTLAQLHDHIKREFKLPANISISPDAYACRVMDALGKDKGGINYPQGYMNHQDGIAHLAKIAQTVLKEIKNEQEWIEEAKREEAKQQRKLELEQLQTVFQGLGSLFDKDIQNSTKGVSGDSRVYYDALGNEKPLEGKIDTFLRNSEDIIKPLYDKHIGTSLDSDDVIEREKALTERLGKMWGWNQSGTRLGDFCDLIKRKILSDEQLQSPFTLDGDSKPPPRDTRIRRQMAQQPTKPSASDKSKAKPQAGLPPMAGGGFNEGLKQELIKQGIARLDSLPPDDCATWVNKLETRQMLAEAGMDSKELWKAVMSQAGDKPLESVTGVSNETVSQDDGQGPKLAFETA